MKHIRRWTALLLAAVLLGLLPATAMAEEIDSASGVAEVRDFEQFQQALEDEAVEEIIITDTVTVPANEYNLDTPLDAGSKPIYVTLSGKLVLENGAAMTSSAPMGRFNYEPPTDSDGSFLSISNRIVDGAAVFLMWEDQDGDLNRLFLGSQPANLTEVLAAKDIDSLSTAVFNGDVTLDGDITADILYVMNGDLNINKGSTLTINKMLHVNHAVNDFGGGLQLEDGAGFEYEPGKNYYPCLACFWSDDDEKEDPIWFLSMTPYDEYEVTFAVYDYNAESEEWEFTDISEEDLAVPAPLSYKAEENHDGKLTLTANGAAWGQKYELAYTKDGKDHTLTVSIELPEIGCYSAPSVSTGNYLTELQYSPQSDNKFYVCVNPDAWFMSGEDKERFTVSDELEVRGVRYSEEGKTEIPNAAQWKKIGDGVWEITVTDCALNVEPSVWIVCKDNEDDSFETGTGLWINPTEALVYRSASLGEPEIDWGFPWQSSFQSSLRDTLSLKAGAGADGRLYLLVYHDRAEDGKAPGWYCEEVHIDQLRAEGVTLTQTDEEDGRAIRVTAPQTAGNYQVIRLQEEENEMGHYEPAPGTTRGLPLRVVVTASTPVTPGTSSDRDSDSDSGSDPAYRVSTPARTTGGSVKVTPSSAGEGERVTVTVKADSGYTLEKLSVTDSKGKELPLTDKGGGVYTFTMPAGKVTVTPVFRYTAAPAVSFSDVPANAYYYDAVRWAVENGITGGTGANTFSPNAPCTRAQTVTFLWRAAGSPMPKNTANPFADVPSNAYYYHAVLWAVEQGITGGTGSGTFSPYATVTRGQTAAFLYRAAKSPAVSGGSAFSDVTPDAYYADAVRWAAQQGITNGTGNGQFSPNAACTRAQIVTFLYAGRGN